MESTTAARRADRSGRKQSAHCSLPRLVWAYRRRKRTFPNGLSNEERSGVRRERHDQCERDPLQALAAFSNQWSIRQESSRIRRRAKRNSNPASRAHV